MKIVIVESYANLLLQNNDDGKIGIVIDNSGDETEYYLTKEEAGKLVIELVKFLSA